MNKSTLSRTLFIRIAPTIVLTIVLIGVLAFYSADKEINEGYDAQLISNANVLWVLVSDEMNESKADGVSKIQNFNLTVANQIALNEPNDYYADSRMFRVWRSGQVVMYSDTAPPASVPRQETGLSKLRFDNEYWRVYTLKVPDQDVYIEVGEELELRDILVANILLRLALPLGLLVPVVGLLIWLGIGNGLGAIHNLVSQIKSRFPNDLSPVDTQPLPKDLFPLGKALNQLFIKLENSFTAEKRFTDHAAHQLRTPQATIKLQLQMLEKATSEEEKNSLLKELMLSNERASKLVNMLLTSARLGHEPTPLQMISVYPVVASVMAELGVLARQKSIDMSLNGAENVQMRADAELLRLLMSNLIENAIKYTPPHGKVAVSIVLQGEICKISVQDTGPGIPPAEREQVFKRFYRITSSETEGSGLGLAIAAEIVERFSGSITLNDAPGGGLLVEVTAPAK